MFKKLFFFALLLSSSQTFASVKCPIEKIQMLRSNGDKIFIQLEGQSWHVLAEQGEQDFEKKYNRALIAQRTGVKVELTFPNGYDETCMSTNTQIVAKKIKLKKNA